MQSPDIRVQKNCRRIQAAFVQLVLATDFDHVSVAAICRNAEVNRSTFYAHYQDKYELLAEITSAFETEFSAQIESCLLQAPAQRRVSMKATFEQIVPQLSLLQMILRIDDQLPRNQQTTRGVFLNAYECAQAKEQKQVSASKQRFYANVFAASAVESILWWLEEGATVENCGFVADTIVDCMADEVTDRQVKQRLKIDRSIQ